MKDRDGYEGVWRTIRGARVFIRTGEDLDSALARHKKQKEEGFGTIRGEKIRSFTLEGEETGDIGYEFSSLSDLYNFMQEAKKEDRKNMGESDTYYVGLNTDNNYYTGYKISKYKGRYKLK